MGIYKNILRQLHIFLVHQGRRDQQNPVCCALDENDWRCGVSQISDDCVCEKTLMALMDQKFFKEVVEHMGVVLNPCKTSSIRVTSSDIDVLVLLQWHKTAKGRKVRQSSEHHYLKTFIYAHENMIIIIIPWTHSAGARKVRERAA